jgi:hypothetical protein
MEFSTIDASAKLANSELFPPHLAAMINVSMAHLLFSDEDKLDGDDLAQLFPPLSAPVPAPPQPAPVPRRQRKRSLTKVCEAARKAGAGRVIVDGVVIALSPAAAVPESDANEWDAVLPEGDHGPH